MIINPPIPTAVLKMLAETYMIDEHDPNGPGRIYCPVCHESVAMKWKQGRQLTWPHDVPHHKDCPVAWANKRLEGLK
jgi:hypothetical protein